MTIENLKESHFVRLLKKYALLLLAFAIINMLLIAAYPFFVAYVIQGEDVRPSPLYDIMPYIIRFLLNLITFFLVVSDSKTFTIRLTAISTLIIFEREIGVALFLLLALYEERNYLLKKSVSEQ